MSVSRGPDGWSSRESRRRVGRVSWRGAPVREDGERLAELLRASRTDDAAAAAFVRTLQPAVWRFVASLLGPSAGESDVAEVVQDTFVRALTGRSGWRG